MKRLLLASMLAALTLVMSLPAMADRDRHHGGHHYSYDRHHDRGKHHRKHHHKKHHHKAHRRVVEHHYYDERRPRHRDYRGHSDIPLVSVDGYPLVRIQVNH